MPDMIPLFEPRVLKGKYLGRVLKSRHLTTGPMVERLREALADHFKVAPSMVVLGSSATACFQVLCDHWWGLPGGPYPMLRFSCPTFVGMTQAARHAHFIIQNDAVDDGERLIHTDIGGWRAGVEDKGAALYDRCHSWIYRGENAALYSFYPTKLCGGAEGGALIVRYPGVAEELQCRLNCGIEPLSKGPLRSLDPKYSGRKGCMTDVQAALNLEALEGMEKFAERLKERWKETARCLRKEGLTVVQQERPYLLQVTDFYRTMDAVRPLLLKAGVPTALNFPGNGLLTVPAPSKPAHRKRVVEALEKVCFG